jgi:hypothetical protein
LLTLLQKSFGKSGERCSPYYNLVPQSAQNFAPAGFCALQFGHATVEVIGAPQSLQNFADGVFFAPHFGQATVTAAAAGAAVDCAALACMA